MKLRRTISMAISLALFSSWTGVAHADELANSAEELTVQTLEHASVSEGIDTSLNVNLTSLGSDIVTSDEAGNIRISNNGGQATVEGNSGSLVIEGSAGHTLDVDGREIATVDAAGSSNVDYAVTVSNAGNVRVHSIIGDKDAPEEYSYSFPGVDAIVLDAETGVAFLFAYIEGEPELVGGVDAPWARDANGVEVPTHFEVQGNVLTQVVEHKSGNFAYPITADPSWWDSVKGWFKSAGSWVVGKAKSAANWLGPKAKWLGGKAWSGTKWVAGKGKVVAKKVGPGALVLCAVGAGWAWYRSDASEWVRVGDAAAGCFL